MQTYFLTHSNTSPYFNIASEEYLLKHTDGFFVYLWRNAPAVIVGVNQNAFNEVNLSYTQNNDIKVVRRLTGGGTVYHDLNNICYTVIAPYDSSKDNYKEFTKPVIDYLNSLGVKAEFSGRNDITIDGKKISGNAQTVYNNRIMHHGTILFKTDMSVLDKALKPSKLKMESKGIKSVRARVTNVSEHLENMTADEFFNGLCDYLKKTLPEYHFSAYDNQQIEKLVKEKYSLQEWNIGYSPKGKTIVNKKLSFGEINLSFDVESGKIQNASLTGDFFSLNDVNVLISKLNGLNFCKESFIGVLRCADIFIQGGSGEEIVSAIFDD